jgi:hypothetical protein
MRIKILLILVLSAFITGCSSSNNQSPTIPADFNSPDSMSIPIIAPSMINNTFSATGIMGIYTLTLDNENLQFELTPARNISIGESYIVSGSAFFTMTPCSDCLKIDSICLDPDGNVVLGMSVKHPFRKGDPLKPPSAVNRLDLDVFDLALLIKPVDITPQSYPLVGTDAFPAILVNADGYTSELSGVTGDQSAIPFKITSENSDFNRFEMSTDYTPFDIILSPGSGITFNLFLTMGYGASATKAERLMPTYYLPEFNRKAAWKIVVTPPNGSDPPSMSNTWNDSDTTSEHSITIDIYDWNYGGTVSASYPDPYNPNFISASSDVGSVLVEVPGMKSSVVNAITSDTTSNGWDDPLTYTASFANENALPAGVYYGIVKVTDTRVPGTSVVGGETDTLVHTPNGINLEWYEFDEFASYQVFPATIVIGCGPITGSIVSPNCPITGVTSGGMIEFSASASSANGGDPVVLYEWDMDYDGLTFDIDASGDTADLGPFINLNCANPPVDPVTFTVAVRATDSCTPPNVTVFDTCDVTVDSCGLGNLVIKVNRLMTYVDGYQVNPAIPYTLTWSPAVGIAQYAIYVDRDASDGITNNLEYVGATLNTTYDCPSGELPSNHYVAGYTYVVKGRSVVGDPSSEVMDSEPAHVIVTGFETHPPPLYSPLNGEGWLANGETTSSDYYCRPIATGANRAHGAWAVQFSRKVGNPATAGFWDGMVHGPHPSIPNSSVRFMDFSMLWRNVLDGGVFIGTCSTKPGSGWTSPQSDFVWSSSCTDSGYYAYDGYNSNICTYFNGCPSGANNVWRDAAYSMNFKRQCVGGDCNLYGDPNDPYVGIECFRNTVPDESLQGDYSNIFLDEVAIVIY